MAQILLIIRGFPGSGKSTLAKLLSNAKHPYFEADQFMVEDGVYTFKPEKLKAAHEACQAAAFTVLNEGRSCIVSNTFTQNWEMKPYLEFCKVKGIPVHVVTAEGTYGSIHGVPDEAMQRMKNRWEAYVPL